LVDKQIFATLWKAQAFTWLIMMLITIFLKKEGFARKFLFAFNSNTFIDVRPDNLPSQT